MVDWPWKSSYSSAIKMFIFCVTGLGDSAFASCRKVTRDQKKNLVNRREVSNGKRSKAHSGKFCDRENKRRTRWDVCNATKVEFGPGLQQGTRKKILRRRRGGARRHRERDKGFLWVGGTAAITDGDTKKQAQKTGLCFVG